MTKSNNVSPEQRRKNISKGLIEYYKTYKNHLFGKHLSEETKRKLSIIGKRKRLSEEHKRKIGEASRKWHREVGISRETYLKIAEKRRGFKHSAETKSKISVANRGNKSWMKGLTTKNLKVKELIEKGAATRKRLYAEGKLKPWNLGKPWSEEVKNKISLKNRRTYEEKMDAETVIKFKQRLSELGKRFAGKNNPMYGKFGELNPHFGKSAQHGKHSFREDLGHHCRSKWEANYARYLIWIGKKYQYEPKTFIIDLDSGAKGTYTPDFLVNGEWQELKGWETRNKLKKWELFNQQYPNEKFVLIDRNKYKEIERFHKYIVPKWEF